MVLPFSSVKMMSVVCSMVVSSRAPSVHARALKARCACGLAVRRAVLDMAREPAWLAIIKEAERIGAHRGIPYAVS